MAFAYPVSWGIDLQTEHERYLTEQYFKKPVFVTDYPKDIKAFYMRLNDDGRTVAAMDLLGARYWRDHRRQPEGRTAGVCWSSGWNELQSETKRTTGGIWICVGMAAHGMRGLVWVLNDY